MLVLFDSYFITEEALKKQAHLLQKIIAGVSSSQIKPLTGVSYNDAPVFRAKINKKARLIYTHDVYQNQKAVLILALWENHNYDQLIRKLKGMEHYIQHYLDQDEREPDEEKEDPFQPKNSPPLKFVPTVHYNGSYLVLDPQQQGVLRKKTPLIVFGPPGSGKTLGLHAIMLNNIPEIIKNNDANELPEIIMVSPSAAVLNMLRKNHDPNCLISPRYITWADLLQLYNPKLKPVGNQHFANFSNKYFPQECLLKTHYELSLRIALGTERYSKLKKRQSYFSEQKDKRNLLEQLLTAWANFLQKNNYFDPMTSTLIINEKTYVFFDEGQNLPPTAYSSCMGAQFIVSLDSEQCLVTTPFIQNCIQTLLYDHYGAYTVHPLSLTWRCPPVIVEAANQVLNTKKKSDKSNRRPYSKVSSVHPTGGAISWVTEPYLPQLKQYGILVTTVVICNHSLSPKERKFINDTLGTNNIVTTEEAIGLEFQTVIILLPFTAPWLQALAKTEPKNLTLEQEHGLNSLYVALTRAQNTAFIYEHPRWYAYGKKLFGPIALNSIEQCTITYSAEDQEKQREKLINDYLNAGRVDAATAVMKYHGMSHQQIQQKIETVLLASLKNNTPTPATELMTKANPTEGPISIAKPTQTKKRKDAKKTPTSKLLQATQQSPSVAKATSPQFKTQKDINKFFSNPDAAKILFTPIDTCLFNELINAKQPETNNIFIKMYQNPKTFFPYLKNYLNAIFSKNRIIFIQILCYPEGRELLLRLHADGFNYFDMLEIEVLCTPSYGKTIEYLPLNHLVLTPKLFKLIANNKKDLAQHINTKEFYLVREAPSSENASLSSHSPFTALTLTSESREELQILFQQRNHLAEAITEELLAGAYKVNGRTKTIEQMLKSDTVGRETWSTLQKIIENKKNKARAAKAVQPLQTTEEVDHYFKNPMFPMKLFEVLPNAFYDFEYIIYNSPQRNYFTTKISAYFEKIAPYLPINLLNSLTTPSGKNNVTLFFILLTLPAGPKLLLQLLNRLIDKTVNFDLKLCLPIKHHQIEGSVNQLTQIAHEPELFEFLINKRPALISSITPQAFYEYYIYCCPETNLIMLKSPFSIFASTTKGRIVLSSLFDQSKLIDGITEAILWQTDQQITDEDKIVNKLHSDECGKQLFSKLFAYLQKPNPTQSLLLHGSFPSKPDIAISQAPKSKEKISHHL